MLKIHTIYNNHFYFCLRMSFIPRLKMSCNQEAAANTSQFIAKKSGQRKVDERQNERVFSSFSKKFDRKFQFLQKNNQIASTYEAQALDCQKFSNVSCNANMVKARCYTAINPQVLNLSLEYGGGTMQGPKNMRFECELAILKTVFTLLDSLWR